MKKILSSLFLIGAFTASIFACPMEEEQYNESNNILINNPNVQPGQVTVILRAINDTRISLVNVGMDVQQLNVLTNRVVRLPNPQVIIQNTNFTNSLTNAQQNATNNGFGSLTVDSVTQRNDGVGITLSSSNNNSTLTTQINTSSTAPVYTTVGAVNVNNEVREVATTTERLYAIQDTYVPTVQTTVVNDAVANKPVEVISNTKVSTNGAGGSVVSTAIKSGGQSTVSGKPSVATTTTIKFTNPDGTISEFKTSTSKLLVVQRTQTTITKANGTTYTVENVGEVVGDVTNGHMNQKRIDTGTKILQGTTITVNSDNEIVIDGKVTEYDAPSGYSIQDVVVHSVNGEPTSILYDASDVAGSNNSVTYWVNGVDTGVTANLNITRTVTTSLGEILRGRTVSTTDVDPYIVGEVTIPESITITAPSSGFNSDGLIDQYIGSYTYQSSGENIGYYLKSNGDVRFRASARASSTVCSSYYSSRFSELPYATEFETGGNGSWRRRDDFIFCSQNTIVNPIWASTKTTLGQTSHPTISSSGSINLSNNRYYVIDGTITTHVVNENDTIVDSYDIVDPAAQNEQIVTTSQSAKVYNASGELVLESDNLSFKNISTLTKSGKTISGTFTRENVEFLSDGANTYYGRTVTASDGILFVDGVNTGFSVNDNTIIASRKECYVVDGAVTDVEYGADDNITNTQYYTNNGVVTSVVKNTTDNVVLTNVDSNNGNSITDTTWTINAGQTTYIASDVKEVTGNKISSTLYGDIFYNTFSTAVNNLVMSGNSVLGFRENAQFYSVTIPSQSYPKGIYSVKLDNYIRLCGLAEPYYLPKYDGYFFVNDGKIYEHKNTNADISPITIPRITYGNGSTGSQFQKTEGAFVLYCSGNTMYLKRFKNYYDRSIQSSYGLSMNAAYAPAYLIQTDLYIPYAMIGGVGRTHCVSCFNNENMSFKSMAGIPGWGRRTVAVGTDGRLRYGNGHITNTFHGQMGTFEEVYLVYADGESSTFVARSTSGDVYLIKGTTFTKVNNIPSVSKIDSNRTGNFFAYSGNTVYICSLSGINVHVSTYNAPERIVEMAVSKDLLGIRTVSNNLFTAETGAFIAAETNVSFAKSQLNNIIKIGACGNRILCVSDGYSAQTTTVNKVRINGVEYNQSDVSFKSETVYVINGSKTSYKVQSSDINTANIPMYEITLKKAGQKTSIPRSSVTGFDYRSTTRAQDGGLLGIVTVSNNKYVINGNVTNITPVLGSVININAVKTYYVGDVDTGVQPGADDSLEIDGDYWTINGRNTKVKFFGLGEMCVRVSDVTPGEVTEDDTSEGSTVVVPLVVRAQIVRFDQSRPITSIRLQYRRLTDENWTNLKEITNASRALENTKPEAIFGRYVNVPVSPQESFYLRVNISDGTDSTVTASALNPEAGNVFYYSFIRSSKQRLQ